MFEKRLKEFEKEYVYKLGFRSLEALISDFLDDFIMHDPRAFEGFVLSEINEEFIDKYNLRNDKFTPYDILCVFDYVSCQ